jgi:hypothetical protein
LFFLKSHFYIIFNLIFYYVNAPTLYVWPDITRIIFYFYVSQISTSPEFVPIEIKGLEGDQFTEVTSLFLPKSQSLVTCEDYALRKNFFFVNIHIYNYYFLIQLKYLHKYTHEDNPTAKIFEFDQSIKLR